MKKVIINVSKKLVSDAVVKLGSKAFPLKQGELLGFRAGLGAHTLIDNDGTLIPGHGKGVFVEPGKHRSAAKDALSWGKTLNARRVDFGKEYEVTDHSLALVAVFRRPDSKDYDYICNKIVDALPEGEDKEVDDIYGVTPSIGKTASQHYIGVEISGGTEDELLQSVDNFIEKLQEFKSKLKFEKDLKVLTNVEHSTKKSDGEKESSKEKPVLSLKERREQKKEVSKTLKNEAGKIREKMTKKSTVSKEKAI